MRNVFPVLLMWLTLTAGYAQNKKPVITGQETLSTHEGKPITLKLTDLYVRETEDQSSGDNGDDDKNDGDPNEGEGNEEDDDVDGGGVDNNDDDEDDDNDDDEDDDNDDDDDNGNNGNGNTGDKDDNKGKDKEKGKDKDKDEGKGKDEDRGKDKGKGEGKGKEKGNGNGGNNRTAAYPEGYTLVVYNGKNYRVSGTTVTPDPGFSGELSVDVSVSNAQHHSPKYAMKITVIQAAPPPQNTPPVITGQLPLETEPGTPLQIKLSDLKVSDSDDQYPEGFTLRLFPGTNYEISETSIIPLPSITGILKVPAAVNDGKDESEKFELKINVKSQHAENIAPEITGQIPLTISMNQSINIVPGQLLVVDPDNNYPADFSLKVFPGANYALEGSTVLPEQDFTGDLLIRVSVHDGQAASETYSLRVSVIPGQNQKPVIIGQAGIKIPEGQRLQLNFSHIIVEDPDNRYPEDFTLQVSGGNHYTVSNYTITPQAGFIGTLTVPVSVNDGQASSTSFNLSIQVIPGDRLEITGQVSLEIPEDSSVVISTADLSVNDPTGTYPAGFTLQVGKGEHYEVSDRLISPHKNFFGNMWVPVTISRAGTTPVAFSLLVVVRPLNDPPEATMIDEAPLHISSPGAWKPIPDIEVVDVDDDHLLYAEILLTGATTGAGTETLGYEMSPNINGIFDKESGSLFLVGRAPLQEYEAILRSVQYHYNGPSDSLGMTGTRKITIKLHDGKASSYAYERLLMFETDFTLEIPDAFTPNNDHANDTWKITPLQQAELLNTFIRVYDKRGTLVFETSALDHEWDGYYNGSPLPADVYFYTIEMDLSYRKVNYKGIVSILR